MGSSRPRPSLSAILITPDTSETLRRTLRCLRQQSVREQIELVFVCLSADALELREGDVTGFHGHQVIEIGSFDSSSKARAAGIRVATAEVVVLTEDHCFPEPGWAEALIERHKEDWAGVGPAVLNANPTAASSWANLLIEYGFWLDPLPGGEMDMLPGHNSSYKRAALLEYGKRLHEILEAESVLQWDLATRGHRLYLEPSARTRHANIDTLGGSFKHRFYGGRLFAANRSRDWSLARRLFYALASPLIPVVRLKRTLAFARRVASVHEMHPWVRLTLAYLLALDGLGEMLGYAFGGGKAMRVLTESVEFHKVEQLRYALAES
jgi:hypothetical protein